MESPTAFTPRAQQTLALARREAARLRHNFVGTEHLLLGLISLGQGTAVTVLGKLGLDLEMVRMEVERQVGPGLAEPPIGSLCYTPRVKKVLALAAKEAKALNHTYVGTEHLLLGLLLEDDGVAGRVLKQLKVDIGDTRRRILMELDPNYPTSLQEECTANVSMDPKPTPLPPDCLDSSKRFDIYCMEGNQQVVYRNALFKGIKRIFPRTQGDILSAFLEIEQSDGSTVFVARPTIVRFCEAGVKPSPDPLPEATKSE